MVLVSHVHGDHLGDRRIESVNASSCAEPEAPIATVPNSNSAEIAVGKTAQIVVGSEMSRFLSNKVEQLGDPASVQLVRFGASLDIEGVSFTTVPAVHSNGLSGDFIEGGLGESLNASEAAYVIDELIRPQAVIVFHANEAATAGGTVQPGTRTAEFMEATTTATYVPFSGRTLSFDTYGRCTAGCGE